MIWFRTVTYEVEGNTLEDAELTWGNYGPECSAGVRPVATSDLEGGEELLSGRLSPDQDAPASQEEGAPADSEQGS